MSMSASGTNTPAPPKFIKINAVRKYNPEYIAYIERQKELEEQEDENNNNNAAASSDPGQAQLDALLGISTSQQTAAVSGAKKSSGWTKKKNSALMKDGSVRCVAPRGINRGQALPSVSSVAEHKKHLNETPVTQNVIDTQKKLEQDEVSKKIGVPKEQIMNNLAFVFAKFELPMGVTEKLLMMEEYDEILMCVDDSASMYMDSDVRHEHGPLEGKIMTRWEEVEQRIRMMLEVIAYIPAPKITIMFLNRKDVLKMEHKHGEAPFAFIGRSFGQLHAVFQRRPMGQTPMFAAIERMFKHGEGRRVLNHIFADGTPSGGPGEVNKIIQLMKNRPNPQNSPFTFHSCTNEDHETEWMKNTESVSPFCAELDDYRDESKTVLEESGRAFNFSFGLYLCCCLCAAINPHDLDALDESVPLTKQNLDRLNGYETTLDEYRYYFDNFMLAQSKKERSNNSLDKLSADYLKTWKRIRHEFETARNSNDIPQVEEYRVRAKARIGFGGACCVIQ